MAPVGSGHWGGGVEGGVGAAGTILFATTVLIMRRMGPAAGDARPTARVTQGACGVVGRQRLQGTAGHRSDAVHPQPGAVTSMCVCVRARAYRSLHVRL